MKKKILKFWMYLRQGHNTYLAFVISFLNFIVIQYRLVIQKHELTRELINHLSLFIILFLAIYIPIAVLLGYLDFKRGTIPKIAKANPYNRDMAKALYYLSIDEKGKARKVLEKWI